MTEATGVPIVGSASPLDAQASPKPPDTKPGWKTSEFVVTLLIAALGGVLASGLLVNNTALQIAGIAMATLKAMSYTWSRTAIKTAAMFFIVLLGVHVTSACGSTASQRQSTIITTGTALNAAKAGLYAFNAQHEHDIAMSATSHADNDAKLAAWHTTRDKLFNDLFVAYDAFAAAVTLDNDTSITGMVQAAAIVAQDLAAAGIKP